LQAIKQPGMDEAIQLTDNLSEADEFLALHSKLKKNSQIQAVVKSRGLPIHVTKVVGKCFLRYSLNECVFFRFL